MVETEIDQQKINKDLLQKRFRCASKTYNSHATVQKQMASCLVKMASKYIPNEQESMTELGCGTGLLSQQILDNFTTKKYTANDLVAEVEENIVDIATQTQTLFFNFIQGDAENISIPWQQNVIWSGATIQWIQDLDSFFLRLSSALNQQGFVAISSFDIDNFSEIKTLTGKGINYKSMEEVLQFASLYFQVLDYKAWHQQLWFNTPRDVLKHMRFTGVNAISKTRWSKSNLENFINSYEMFKQDEGYPLTYNPFVFILQKK